MPFDKGIGICVMTTDNNHKKLNDIVQLPQFEKVLSKRKNEKNPILKEEERVTTVLKRLLEENKISEALYNRLKPIGSQPPRLYGLAKIHKQNVPVRPVLSMPGSVYYKIGNEVSEWLSVVTECKINSSTKEIADSLPTIELDENKELISFDVVSLYTNVPLKEAIETCTDLLYSGRYPSPTVDRGTFKELVCLCSCDVIMLTQDGYYRQTDGLAMGSPPAPQLANGWMSKFDDRIRDNAILYARYMDDILRESNRNEINAKLCEINSLHPALQFTIERESESSIPFLDMKIERSAGTLSSRWYTKPTDTGLTLNFHAFAPLRYKKSVVSGLVHRIHRSCSNWRNFHECLEKAKIILENNQYPKTFYDPIISKTLSKIVERSDIEKSNAENEDEDQVVEKKMVFVNYRGKISDNFGKSLMKLNAPCRIIFTLRKLKSSLPSLKPPVEKSYKSGVVYHIECPRCNACYVGQTSRHLVHRIKEHRRNGPVANHLNACSTELTMENVTILRTSNKSVYHLMTLEALMINHYKPNLNTKDEYRSRSLVIKI